MQGIRGQRESACSCTSRGEWWGPGAWMETRRRPSRWEMGAQSSQLPVGGRPLKKSAPRPPASSLHHSFYGWTHLGDPQAPPLEASEEPQLYNFWASHSPTPGLSFSQLLWSINLGQSQAHNKRCVNLRGVGLHSTHLRRGGRATPREWYCRQARPPIQYLARGRRCFPRRCLPLLPLPLFLSLSPQRPSRPPSGSWAWGA